MDPSTPAKLKVTELRAELTSRGLSSTGLKKDLVQRLQLALVDEQSPKSSLDDSASGKENVDTAGMATDGEEITLTGRRQRAPHTPTRSGRALRGRRDKGSDLAAAEPVTAEEISVSPPSEELGASTAEVAADTPVPAESVPEIANEVTKESAVTESPDPVSIESAHEPASKESENDEQEPMDAPTKPVMQQVSDRPLSLAEQTDGKNDSSEFIEVELDFGEEDDDASRVSIEASAPAGPSGTEIPARTASADDTTQTDSGFRKRKPVSPVRWVEALKKPKMDLDEGSPGDALAPSTSTSTSSLIAVQVPRSSSRVLSITNLTRPFQPQDLEKKLQEFGQVNSFWVNQIRSRCIVMMDTLDAGFRVRKSMHGIRWPDPGRRPLFIEFITETRAEELKAKEAERERTAPAPASKSNPSLGTSTGFRNLFAKATKAAVQSTSSVPLPENPAVSAVSYRVVDLPKPVHVDVDKVFRKTTTQPAIYYLPVSEGMARERAERRQRTNNTDTGEKPAASEAEQSAPAPVTVEADQSME